MFQYKNLKLKIAYAVIHFKLRIILSLCRGKQDNKINKYQNEKGGKKFSQK